MKNFDNEWIDYIKEKFSIELSVEDFKAYVLLPKTLNDINITIALSIIKSQLLHDYFLDNIKDDFIMIDFVSFKLELKLLDDDTSFYKKCSCCDKEHFINYAQVIYSNYGGTAKAIHVCSEKCKFEYFKALKQFTDRVSLTNNVREILNI